MSETLLFALELTISGLLVGLMYSLVALGFVLIYKASGVFNFAQGDMTFLAALALASFVVKIPLWISLIVVLAIMLILAMAVERIVLKPLVARPPLVLFMATIGVAFFLQGLAQGIWGTQPRGLELGLADQTYDVAGMFISNMDILGAVVAGILLIALVWFFQKTKTGRALRAVSDDHEAALAVGIPLRKAWGITWAIAGIVAIVAGALWGSRVGVQASLALLALKALPVLIIGGIDSIPGAILGGLIIGAAENLAEGLIGPAVGGGIKNFFPYLLALIVLAVRPYGLFGREIIERV
ncbi:MAG: branched-chain amino acid ABC transporter permease [Deltaproteobacteria bacterium]|nr:branched-chain amino acid ABC transporter permease [Deltaproteobacteria bacterium]